MPLIFFGSGAFGLPTLDALIESHDVAMVVTQPDRPAGRRRVLTPTPIGERAAAAGIDTLKPERVNDPALVARIRAASDVYVVIAYGQKLGADLLAEVFAINLHASLLPRFRGAAPINRAILAGDVETGVSVITLAATMDAGDVLGRRVIAIDPNETAGELHDRLAVLGPEAIGDVLAHRAAGTLAPEQQDAAAVTQAPKLHKDEGTVAFDRPADEVRAFVHGLSPWPGCTVRLGAQRLKLLRVDVIDRDGAGVSDAPGTVDDEGGVVCLPGRVRLVTVQPPGGKPMPFDAFRRGRDFPAGARLESL